MLAKNFTWSNSIYLNAGGYVLDLHNCYDFRSCQYDVLDRTVELNWVRGTGEWVNQEQPSALCIKCVGVYFFRFTPRNASLPFTEDDCLSSFGYDVDEEWAEGQFWVDSLPEDHWYWSFSFQSDAEILVGGESASVQLLP